MRRAWQTWVIFGACLVLVLLAMGWVTRVTLRLERAQAQARHQADTEEAIRLALWRMDSGLATLIARESARPYFAYIPLYPAERAYAGMFNPVGPGETLAPSPLLMQDPPYVLLHFQLHPDGRLSSPQVPTGNARTLAQGRFTTRERIDKYEALLARIAPQLTRQVLDALPHDTVPTPIPPAVASPPLQMPESSIADSKPTQQETKDASIQKAKDAGIDYRMRVRIAQDARSQNIFSNQASNARIPGPQSEPGGQSIPGAESAGEQAGAGLPSAGEQAGAGLPSAGGQIAPDAELRGRRAAEGAERGTPSAGAERGTPSAGAGGWVTEGALTPLAVGNLQLLARRVSVNGQEFIQGCWLDWPAIEGWLLPSIRDLLPEAKLEPVKRGAAEGSEHLLASLPVRLIPGHLPPASERILSPVRVSLLIVWGCLALAGLASALLLLGTIMLSQRQAAFTSAVTHELRTPLTTFRMYAEMLAGGMVIGEDKRREYLDTLAREAERLSHLVENVLAYARLEKNSSAGRREPIGVRHLLDQVTARLRERADRAGMSLVVEADPETLAASIATDASAVEQVLFNLVDNACKYAAGAHDKRIHLQASVEGRHVHLRVRDHGPGIAGPEARRLFRPFSKSAREAANSSVPGVGLGLALSRRLARRMRGGLSLDKGIRDGACFVLTMDFIAPRE